MPDAIHPRTHRGSSMRGGATRSGLDPTCEPASPAALLEELRARLATQGYDAAGLRRLLGIASIDEIGVLNYAVAIERVRDVRSPLATLVRVFFLEQRDAPAALRRALGARLFDAMVSRRVLAVRNVKGDGHVESLLRFDPVAEQIYVADLRFRDQVVRALTLPSGDPVYPPSSDSVLLTDCVVIPDGAEVLDLCTGSGVQALRQARSASRLVAVDINPRAVAMSRRNAWLNRVENFESRQGDLYDAVRDERFDIVLANPPFVSSPYDDAPSYHAGGPRGDRVLRRVFQGLRSHLTPGGRAFAVSHVGLRREEELEQLAGTWFKGFSGRAAVLKVEVGSALDLAAAQSLFALRDGTESYGREIRRWLTYLKQHRIECVALILVVAEHAGAAAVEVIDARPRVFPLPMAPPPEQRIAEWLNAKR